MIKSIHLKALVILLIYALVGKGTLIFGLLKTTTPITAFVANVIPSVVFGLAFLYVFSHEDFFRFAKDIEKKNNKKEKGLIEKFKHYGKMFSTIFVTFISGPLFGALTARILINNFRYKYLLIAITVALSSMFWMGMFKGLINFRY